MRKQLVSVAHCEIERRLGERDDQGRCRGEVFGLVKRYELPIVRLAVEPGSVDQLLVDVQRLRAVVAERRQEVFPQQRSVRQERPFGEQEHTLRRGGR